MHVIKFGSQIINYELIRSNNRKSISLSVDESGVRVIAPTNAEFNKIEKIVYRKAPWIRKQQLYFNDMHQVTLRKNFVAGEKLPYLGRNYRLKVNQDSTIVHSVLKFQQGTFQAIVPYNLDTQQYRDALQPLYAKWIQAKGLAFAKERYKRFTDKFEFAPRDILISKSEKNWGSCTPEGKVYLNWRVFLAPTSIIDYVLVHELAHLKHMDHSQEYWQTVKMLLPNYEERKEWLRLHGKSLDI